MRQWLQTASCYVFHVRKDCEKYPDLDLQKSLCESSISLLPSTQKYGIKKKLLVVKLILNIKRHGLKLFFFLSPQQNGPKPTCKLRWVPEYKAIKVSTLKAHLEL